MTKLSDEMIKKYIRSGGVFCPFCEDYNITVYDRNSDESGIYEEVQCNSCGKKWTDFYKLVDIYYETIN